MAAANFSSLSSACCVNVATNPSLTPFSRSTSFKSALNLSMSISAIGSSSGLCILPLFKSLSSCSLISHLFTDFITGPLWVKTCLFAMEDPLTTHTWLCCVAWSVCFQYPSLCIEFFRPILYQILNQSYVKSFYILHLFVLSNYFFDCSFFLRSRLSLVPFSLLIIRHYLAMLSGGRIPCFLWMVP